LKDWKEKRLLKKRKRKKKRRMMPDAGAFWRNPLKYAALFLAAVVLCVSSFSQTSDDCLMCHGDKGFSVQRGQRKMDLFVDKNALSKSMHKGLDCVNCHSALEKSEFPHVENVPPVVCASCHDTEGKEFDESLHGKAFKKGDPLAPSCKECHGYHNIISTRDKNSVVAPIKIPYLCGKCHREGSPVQLQRDIPQDRIIENYSESIHGEGLLKKGLSVSATCASCHTAHHILPHTDPKSSISRANIANTCTKCHAEIELVHKKVIKGALWEKEANVLPACPDCHQPHKVRNVYYEMGMADNDCLLCHQKREIRSSKDGRSLYIEGSEVRSSTHSKIACAQCHVEVSPTHKRACETIKEKVKCDACHEEIGQEFLSSTHGQLYLAGDTNAPTCKECHGTHHVLKHKDSASPSFPTNIPTLCARCHREGEKAALKYTGTEKDIVKHYTESIHGKGLLKSGLTVTATCADCHSPHHELPADNPESTVNPANLPKTCGKCHNGVYEKFEKSIHATAKTDKKLPTCKDCHASHTINRADLDNFRFDIMEKCGKCHEDIAKTYFDTFHGKASRLGFAKAAKCYDCHGSHDILPISNPDSHLSRRNIVETCRKCHPQATRRFAGYLTHATHHDPKKYPFIFYSFWFMTILLVGTLAFAGIHTLLWLPRAFQMRSSHKREKEPAAVLIRRFTSKESTLHILMIISFLSLSITGLTLKFSYTAWAQPVSKLLGGFETTGIIHRAAALLMFSVFVAHVMDLLTKKRKESGSLMKLVLGRNTMIPNLRDLREFIGTILWFLGKKKRPDYGRWTYWEKFDYFAVFWGVFIIGSTGLMLWFSEFFTKFLPGWLINVATIIHSDEALLATGFIFTVHFFNTHLRPEKFPMDTVIFTGGLAEEELKTDKPDEYKYLVESGLIEKQKMENLPPHRMKAAKIFAWTALALGFFVILWIVYAMLFAYK
jgi:cytochrome b subunit of formate dehydrogenase